MKTLAVLLTVFNRKIQTLKCLSQLYNQSINNDIVIDVYLVDDGCTDGTLQAVLKEFPSVKVIHGDGSLFWNRGMWTAWDYASKQKCYDYYFWINDDTFIYDYAIKILINVSEHYDNKCIVIGPCQSLDRKTMTYGGYTYDRNMIKPNGNEESLVTLFNGNIVLVPSYVFQRLGNLDYYYTHSHGDIDYGIRAHHAGIKVYQCKDYLGECDRHEKMSNWCNPEVPFMVRWKAMYKPNGCPPNEQFHEELKYKSFFVASFHYFTIHLRCLFPRLWLFFNKGEFLKS